MSILCDEGPDWRTDSPYNIVKYGRLWGDLKLEGLFWLPMHHITVDTTPLKGHSLISQSGWWEWSSHQHYLERTSHHNFRLFHRKTKTKSFNRSMTMPLHCVHNTGLTESGVEMWFPHIALQVLVNLCDTNIKLLAELTSAPMYKLRWTLLPAVKKIPIHGQTFSELNLSASVFQMHRAQLWTLSVTANQGEQSDFILSQSWRLFAYAYLEYSTWRALQNFFVHSWRYTTTKECSNWAFTKFRLTGCTALPCQ